jgi:hypothetical protein
MNRAYKKMVSFHSEEVFVSEGGSTLDSEETAKIDWGSVRNGDYGVTPAKNSIKGAQRELANPLSRGYRSSVVSLDVHRRNRENPM